MPGSLGSGWKCGSNMDARVAGLSTAPCGIGAVTQEGGDVAGHVGRGGVRGAPAQGQYLAVDDRSEPAGAQHVPGGQLWTHPLGSDQVGVLHAQRPNTWSRR